MDPGTAPFAAHTLCLCKKSSSSLEISVSPAGCRGIPVGLVWFQLPALSSSDAALMLINTI